VEQTTGDRGFSPGEARKLRVYVYGGGGRTATSFYKGPVTVTFNPPEGITVDPNPAVIDMKPANSYDRSKSWTEVTLTINKGMAAGDCSLPLSAKTDQQTSAECTFQFTILNVGDVRRRNR
jgi:uncharacterized membrane protein